MKYYDCEIIFHPGKPNVVADTLSRKANCTIIRASCMEVTTIAPLLDMIRQAQDESVKGENQGRERIKGKVVNLVKNNQGLLSPYNRIWVPYIGGNKQVLLEEAHKSNVLHSSRC